jgi:FkbM family methyltransferase
MISYAQNYEDVIVRRALRDPPNGFYVDVGAADPLENSVTHYFYERGWSGINVEPEPRFYSRLVAARARDINLDFAVARESGEARLTVVAIEAELSTLDPAVAERYVYNLDTTHVTVATKPLEEILRDHATRPIDFLKIDVEGKEGDALASFDLRRWAPRVLVVEATWPGTSDPSHHDWEPGVLAAGYELGLFDGLNRFYAQVADGETLAALRAPANLFDQFIEYRWWKMLGPAARAQLASQGYPNPDL